MILSTKKPANIEYKRSFKLTLIPVEEIIRRQFNIHNKFTSMKRSILNKIESKVIDRKEVRTFSRPEREARRNMAISHPRKRRTAILLRTFILN